MNRIRMQRIAAAHVTGIPEWKALAACFAAMAIFFVAVQESDA
ncbi:MAG TPA: hypothetical protein VF336_00210 [Syntrophales bacterium]